MQELWDSVITALTDPVDPEFVRDFQESTIAKPVLQAFFETVVQESLKVPACLDGIRHTLGACATVINLREGFGTTTIESKTNFFAPALQEPK